jgi:hypothetical protein
MADQMGRHDAMGPLARRPHGTNDPARYLKPRVTDRRKLAFHAMLLCTWVLILGIRGGGVGFTVAVLVGLLLFDIAVVAVARIAAAHRERQRRAAGQAPSWPARLLAVSQAREAGLAMPPGIRNDRSFRGRLTHDGQRWHWTATPSRIGPEIPTLPLPADWTPILNDRVGYRHVLTFVELNGGQLDFSIGARRDLLNELNERRR